MDSQLNPSNMGRVTSDLSHDLHDLSQQEPSLPMPSEPSLQTMSVSELADRCIGENSKYRCGEPCNEQYYVELFRRAIVQRDLLAREVVQQLFYEKVLCWMRAHPLREATAYFDNEENGVTQTFERFWQVTAQTQKLEFSALTAILRYLWVILNGILLDRQRAYSLSQQVGLKEPGRPGKSYVDQSTDSVEPWQLLQGALPNAREQRLAYLLFHCGLGPREIALQCSQEFNDEHEIYQLRRNIMVRLMHLRLSSHDQDETLHRDRVF